MSRIKSNKWKNVPVQPYTVTTENGKEIINPLRSGPNMGLIPTPRFSDFKRNGKGFMIGNNRTQRKGSRLHPVQYIPNSTYLEAVIGYVKGVAQKAMITVKNRTFRKVFHNKAY